MLPSSASRSSDPFCRSQDGANGYRMVKLYRYMKVKSPSSNQSHQRQSLAMLRKRVHDRSRRTCAPCSRMPNQHMSPPSSRLQGFKIQTSSSSGTKRHTQNMWKRQNIHLAMMHIFGGEIKFLLLPHGRMSRSGALSND